MQIFPFYVVVLTCLIVKGRCETMQCYECDVCNELSDSLLQSCPPDPSTDEPASSTTDFSETSSELSTLQTEGIAPMEGSGLTVASNQSVRIRRSTRDTVNYYCFSIEKDGKNELGLCAGGNVLFSDGEKRTTKKGCVDVMENQKACDVLKDRFGASEEQCKVCSEDRCNSSGVLKWSSPMILFVAVVCLFY